MNTRYETVANHRITDVWSGQASSFDLYTRGQDQFVVYYAADQSIAAAQRQLDETEWTTTTVTESRNNVWDNHNSLALTIDADGYLHLAGDLHVDQLKYFRSTEPLDVTTLERVQPMVGDREDRTTYPRFFDGPDGELIFEYRHGKSGAGDWLYNRYDLENQHWERLIYEPLLVGGERSNPYLCGPTAGPDGYYHLAWGWRDHPAAQQQHDIYYARSKDLRHWETSQGDYVRRPIGEGIGELVDPVPPWHGNLNGVNAIGFDTEERVILTYRKFDSEGNTQIYNARAEEVAFEGLHPEKWTIYETSNWEYRDAFGGSGSLGTVIGAGSVEPEPDGRLSQTYTHPVYGRGKWIVDEETLQPVEWRNPWYRYPQDLREVRSAHPAMAVQWNEDSGKSPSDVNYVLRWEAEKTNESHIGPDHPDPPTTPLELYEFKQRE